MATRLRRALYRRCRDGEAPAELLDAQEREWLVAELHAAGMTDVEIAERTDMSTYTAVRIRQRIGLRPNRERKTRA